MIFRRAVKHRIAKKLLENVPNNHFLPYPYQLDLLDTSFERNTIICLSNEVTKNFIVLSLIREMRYDNKGKHVLYFAQDKVVPEAAKCIARHTDLAVSYFVCEKPYTNWDFIPWASEIKRNDVTVLSTWLIPSFMRGWRAAAIQLFMKECIYLLVLGDCNDTLDPNHPYYKFLGPKGLNHFGTADDIQSSLSSSGILFQNRGSASSPRIVCFTSALLPREITDPKEAETRLIELEKRTNCRLETASELLTMLSLGARPQEHVLACNNMRENLPSAAAVHEFVSRVLVEAGEFLSDVELQADAENSVPSNFSHDHLNSTQVPDSRGRMICVLDYCRRAVLQCEEILRELGVWCAAQIARVFVKHLVGLDRRRVQLLGKNQREFPDNKGLHGDGPLPEHGEDQLARLLRFTATQLCMIVRLFQVEFDTCLTLETFRTMVSPKILTLIEQLKAYKPNVDFRIEVAELPTVATQTVGRKTSRRRSGRSRSSSCSNVSGSSFSSIGYLSGEASPLSDSSEDTMSSLSDGQDDSDAKSTSSRKSSLSCNAIVKSRPKRRRSKGTFSKSGCPHPRPRDLHFVPASELNNGGIRPDIDPSQLVYRAVLTQADGTTARTGNIHHTTRLCGLVLVPCQFTAYALSRLIDELCIWDVDLYFIKPGHLFSSQTTDDGQSRSNYAANRTALQTGDESVAAPQGYNSAAQASLSATQEETIDKFRRGSINLLVATQAAVSAAAGGAELPRCNLVMALQPPRSLAEYLSSKARSRLVDHGAQVVYLIDEKKPCPMDDKEIDVEAVNRSTKESCLAASSTNTNGTNNQILSRFQKLEQLLVQRCRGYGLFADEHDVDPSTADKILPPFFPRESGGPKLLLSKAINAINQFCARLPSDYLTNLTPRWRLRVIPQPPSWTPPSQGPGAACGPTCARRHLGSVLYQCLLRLPINTPLKEEIAGEPMACKKLAKLSAALNALKTLQRIGELDSRWEPSPITSKDAGGNNWSMEIKSSQQLSSFPGSPLSPTPVHGSDTESELGDLIATCNPETEEETVELMDSASRRRQYYFRKFADQMANCFPQTGDPSPNYLYYIDMRLVNSLPEYQNARGRPCHRPEQEPLGFGLLTTKPLHHIPSFPIFSRSGEETVRLVELWSPLASDSFSAASQLPFLPPPLTEDELERLVKFHRIVFQGVLRVERDAVIEFNFKKAYNQVVLVPVRRDTLNIDWEFVNLVLSSYGPEGVCRLLPRRNLDSTPVPTSPGNPVKTKITERCRDMPSTMVRGTTVRSRASHRARSLASKLAMDPLLNQPGIFEFREEDFLDTVVMPAYRNLDQPQHYYVAEIRYDLSPLSPFPSSAYPNFAAYYTTKYEAALTTMEQPLLDVDFTVLRLNLLVPRYLDIRGHCLPCSTEARKRDRRENLTHKQILIPELCFRHPFPASVWRKAVCLPSILYRLHCLLLAEELRRRIAYETSLGRARLPKPKSILKDEFMNASSITSHDLFEPLRLRFPLDLKQEGSEGEPARSAEKAGSSGRGRRRRRRGQRDPKEKSKSTITPEKIPEKSVNQRKEQLRAVNTKGSVTKGDNVSDKEASVDSTKGDELEEGELEDEAEEALDEEDESMNERESPDTTEQSKPTVLRLQATTAASGVPSSSSTNGRLRVNGIIESLLEETKVIELDEIGSVDVTENPDSDALMLIQNKMNADKEYFETGSDVESFDSFEGICRFFPSDDDREVDDEGDENDGQEPTFGHTSCTGMPTTRAYRPGPANVLQALTMSCSNDFINLERMETIGDSFLKFVVTVHLYLSYPQAHEGKLSHLRSRVVCNANLHRLGRIKHLPDRMVAGKFSPCENWVPPGYVVRHDKRQNNQTKKDVPAVDLNIWSTDPLMDDEVLLGIKANEDVKTETVDNFAISDWDPDAPEVVQTQHKVDQCLVLVQQAIPDKSVADCVEALVGCYLTSRGERSALRLMRWFGIDCLPAVDGYLRPSGAPWVQPPPAIGPSDPRWNNLIEAHLAWRFDELETRLQYTFKDPSLLIQAFTHPSYHQLRKAPRSNPDLDTSTEIFLTDTDCYQRLEFLGDAVLDYVITRFLYDDSKQHSPGVLTDLRSALVNNNIFAALAVRIGLHEFLRASSPQLLYTIDAFVRYQKEVVKDDLDFITNEDIEIRPPDPVDPLREETTHSLAGNIANLNTSIPPSRSESSQEDGQTCTKEGVSPQKETGTEVIGEEDEDHETADAGVLVDANDRESQWQESEAQKLMENFVGISATTKQSVPESKPTPACGVSSSASTTGRPTAQVVNRVSDDLEIPKALGDIFESLAGAIFLDSGLSLDTVWAVFYPLMKERIERYTACIPKSPVRQLLELEPEGTKFERPRRTADGRVSVCAHVLGKGRFYGIGRNYRLAKSLAAKRALRVLRKLHRTQPLSVDSPSTGQKI